VSAIVILGVAMLEEIRMRRDFGDGYDAYARRTPFMLPLPGIVRRVIEWPYKCILKNEYPVTGRDVALVLAVYLGILMLLSVPFIVFNWPPGGHLAGSHAGWWSFPFNVPPFNQP
jgi:hypothetical protein